MPLLPPNYAQKAQTQARISGVTTPDIKTMTGQVGSVFATQLNPTRIVKVAQQGDSNRTILTKGTGSCGAVSTHNTPMAIPYLTSQMLDSYGLPVEWGPQADDRIRIEYSTPGNPLALHRVKPNVSKLPLTGLDVGKGLVKIDYGKRDITTPDGVVHPAPGVTDPVVQKPKLQVELATIATNPASGLMFGGTDTNGVMLDLATVAGVNVSGLLMNGGDDINGLIANVDGTSIIIDPTTRKLRATGSGSPTGNLIAKRGTHIDSTATPTETVTLALHAGTELTDATPYLYALTYQTLAKETPHGPTATITTTTGNQEISGTVGAVDTTANPDVVSRGLYRSHDGGVTFHLVTTLNLTAQTYLDNLTDTVVDANQQPPTTNDTVIETWLKPLTSGLLNTAGTDGNRLAIATTNTGTALGIPSGTGLLTVQYDPAFFNIDGSNRLTFIGSTSGLTCDTLLKCHDDSLYVQHFFVDTQYVLAVTDDRNPSASHGQFGTSVQTHLGGTTDVPLFFVRVYPDPGGDTTWGGGSRDYPVCEISNDGPANFTGDTRIGYSTGWGAIAGIGTLFCADRVVFENVNHYAYGAVGARYFECYLPAQFYEQTDLASGSTVNGVPLLSNPVTTGLVVSPTSSGSTPLTVNNSTGTALLTTSPAGSTTITATGTTGTALSAYAPSTTSGSLLTLGTTSGGTTTPLVTVTPTTTTIGTATASNDVTINGDLSVLPTNPLSVSVIVNAPATQSALLTDWKVNGVHKASVAADGTIDSATGFTVNHVPLSTAGAGELLMTNGVTNPPVPISNEAGDDWLYQG